MIGRLHWSIYLRGFIVLIAAIALLVLSQRLPDANGQRIALWAAAAVGALALLLLLGAWIRRRATEIVVTDRRVIFKRGLLSRHTVEMNVSKIETVDVEQGSGRPHLGLWHGGDPWHRARVRAPHRRRRAAEHPECDCRRVGAGSRVRPK